MFESPTLRLRAAVLLAKTARLLPAAVTATIRLFDGPVLLGSVPVSLGPHAVSQYNDIYSMVGFGTGANCGE